MRIDEAHREGRPGPFTFISSTGERIGVELFPALTEQSTWLSSALEMGEEEGIVPVASPAALRDLLAYMQHHATQRDTFAVSVPISCTCELGVDGLGYDVQHVLPPSDLAFLEERVGPAPDGTWPLEAQEELLELLVTADFVGHSHLCNICAAYLSCRVMSATESDILRWFGPQHAEEREGSHYPKGIVNSEEDATGTEEEEEDEERLRLNDEERLRILRVMRKYIDLDE